MSLVISISKKIAMSSLEIAQLTKKSHDDLFNITDKDGKKVVSARELYGYLGYNKSQWKRWFNKNIIKNEFATENEDYVGFDIMSNGNQTRDFAITLDFAKKISNINFNSK